MYYPYLRSKQNEMLALRAMAESRDYCAHISPVIEPIRDLSSTMLTAMDRMDEAGVPYAVVLNSSYSENTFTQEELLAKISDKRFVPAFLCDGDVSTVTAQVVALAVDSVMLIFKNSIDSENEALNALFEKRCVTIVVGNMGRSVKKRLKSLGKNVVTFNTDAFRSVTSNASYADCIDEKYTEEHAFYEEDNFDGFADFCVLPKELASGGMTPTTLAIHLTYKRNQEEIWVRHFLSDTRMGRENIQKKFEEAAKHVRTFFLDKVHTKAVDEILECLSSGHYPGLGALKKYSIMNHLELVNRILEEQEHAE